MHTPTSLVSSETSLRRRRSSGCLVKPLCSTTFATHMLALGAPITYVAAQLGHAKQTTTLADYAHWIPRGD